MKRLVFSFGLFFCGLVPVVLAQPDPRDSVILESRTVLPGNGPGYLTIRVSITNKDSVYIFTLAVREASSEGNAYTTLGYPRDFSGVITPLTNTLDFYQIANLNGYNSASPDSFLFAGVWDPLDPSTIEPPNFARKAFWEIKFDSVRPDLGTVELDSVTFVQSTGFVNFIDNTFWDVPVNFVKGVITVRPQPDPRDSVILESKTVLPGIGHPAFTMKVYITNKDSLTALELALTKRRGSGGADVFTPRICCQDLYLNFLTNTLPNRGTCIPGCNTMPYEPWDTLFSMVTWDFYHPSTMEPPNATRKALLEIKFDTVLSFPGVIELDSARSFGGSVTLLRNARGRALPVNFVRSVITVMPKGDFNMDGSLGAADVVELLNGVFSPEAPNAGAYPFDLNCDGVRSPADVIWELFAVFNARGFPC